VPETTEKYQLNLKRITIFGYRTLVDEIRDHASEL